jgi:hypothetical protein
MINKSALNRSKAIALTTTGLALGLVWLNWPRRDLRVSTDPKWLQVTEFIRSADEVKTYATTEDIESEAQLAAALQANPNRGELVKITGRSELLDHLAILPQLPGDEIAVAACFCPHHFVFAKKGNTTLRIDICYGCGSSRVKSTRKELTDNFPIKPDAKQDSGMVFGIQAGGHEEGFGCRYFGG